MFNFKQYINQPYPYFGSPWKAVGIISFMILFIMVVFEPYNFRINSLIQFGVLVSSLTLTTLIAILTFVVLPRIFPHFYNPNRWTIAKNWLHSITFLVLLSVSVVSIDLLLSPKLEIGTGSILFSSNRLINKILTSIFSSTTAGIIPLLIITFLTQNKALKQHIQESTQLNQIISTRTKQESKEQEEITLSASTRDSITLTPTQIRYLEASGNYVNIYFIEENKICCKLLRTTISQIEKELETYPEFIRCHRAYIINTAQITHVTGNAKGYKIDLAGIPNPVPVSRTYIQAIKEILHP